MLKKQVFDLQTVQTTVSAILSRPRARAKKQLQDLKIFLLESILELEKDPENEKKKDKKEYYALLSDLYVSLDLVLHTERLSL